MSSRITLMHYTSLSLITQNSHTRRAYGFSLLELMVVLVILGLITFTAAPRFTNVIDGLEAKSASRDLASALRYARGQAIASGKATSVVMDIEARKYWVTDRERAYQLPNSIELGILIGHQELYGQGRGAIRFYPDGSASGGHIRVLSRARDRPDHVRQRYDIEIHWLTGRIKLI